MADQTLQLRLTQKLALAPQLQQAIRLLQLNRIELREYIQDALDSNPLLERIEADTASTPDTADTFDDRGAETQDRDGSDREPGESEDWDTALSLDDRWTERGGEAFDSEPQIAD